MWRSSWYPVFDLGGDLIAVDTATPEGEVWVVHFEPIDGDPTRRLAHSLSGFLGGVADQFERGDYVWDEDSQELLAADGSWVDLYEESP